MKTKMIAIVGPTASGKTSLSIDIAKRYGGEIISADSRQVYIGLDIGTEKVTKEEMNGIPHHLLDIANPKETITVSDFVKAAKTVIAQIVDRDRLPIVAGGTGFYIDALLYGNEMPEVPPNPTLRAALEQQDTHTLFEQLIQQDPKRASTIDPHNKRRLVRALEIIDALGTVPEPSKKKLIYDALILGIKTDDEILRERINTRLSESMKKGLIEEVKTLREGGLSWERLYELGLEYRLVSDYLQGNISENELIPKMETALRQYAKRQMTWFKRNKDIKWYAVEDKHSIYNEVEEFLKRV